MIYEQTINGGGVFKYAKYEYEYLFQQHIPNWIIVLRYFFSNETFRVNVYINWLQQPKKHLRKRIIKNILETKYRCVISLNAHIGRHFYSYSADGTVIGDGVQIGDRCHTYAGVTFGQKNGRVPCVGSDVVIGKGAVIIGDVRIGNNSFIEDMSVVIHDVPDGVTVSGIPACIHEA